MGLYLLDYGAGNVQSLANSLKTLGYSFEWISQSSDFDNASRLIFPGVGSFGSAVRHLTDRGLMEPLRQYIRSGRPYFGICIGMQLLFNSSEESPEQGLGIIPGLVKRLSSAGKTVPHMGWNSADHTSPEDVTPLYYYFVHSFCAKYEPEEFPKVADWVQTTTQYGDELFISSICQSNIYCTQFHPEKSGSNGLALLEEWMRGSRLNLFLGSYIRPSVQSKHRLTKRIVACMDVRTNDDGDLVVTKGDQYDVREKAILRVSDPTSAGVVRNLGKPVTLAARYYISGADELCLLNITSFRHSPLRDQPMLAVIRAAAECVFVPLTVGGGIKDTVDPDGTRHSALEVAAAYFRAGADKVSIGSEAVYAVERLQNMGRGDGTSAIETISRAYGSQAVVVSVDPRRVYVNPKDYRGPHEDELIFGDPDEPNGNCDKAWWYQCTVSGGRESRPVSVVELVRGVEQLGAGEILLNSIDRDGTGLGFDLALIKLVKGVVKIPVVASSGAGAKEHFVQLFKETDVEAALAAGIFHREEVTIQEVKEALKASDIYVRLQNQ